MVDPDFVPLTICADDYGLGNGIDAAVLALIEKQRISAVSCMVVGTSWQRSAPRLREHHDRTEIGLHFTLTHLPPAGPMPRLAARGRLPELGGLVRDALIKHLDRDEITAEFCRQIDRFATAMGFLPDFIDGHQHVHQLPVVRDAVLAVFRDRLAGAWLRYPAMPPADALVHRVAMRRTWVISALGLGLRARGRALGINGNGMFRGVRDGRDEPPFAQLFRRFARGLAGRSLLMCHPGLEGDPFLADREQATRVRRDEYEFLNSGEVLDVMDENRLRLATLGRP
jgi:predicted glycoside hydrolase/deacetylase ChbG (UPF0249 family)